MKKQNTLMLLITLGASFFSFTQFFAETKQSEDIEVSVDQVYEKENTDKSLPSKQRASAINKPIMGKGDNPTKFPGIELRDNAVLINAEQIDALTTNAVDSTQIDGGRGDIYGQDNASRIFSRFENRKDKYFYGVRYVTSDGKPLTESSAFQYIGHVKNGFDIVYVQVSDVRQGGIGYDPKVEDSDIVPVRTFTETPDFKKVSSDYAVKVMSKDRHGKAYLTSKQTVRKSKEDIENYLENDLEFEVYDMRTAQKIDKDVIFLGTTLPNGKTEEARGNFDINIAIDNVQYTMKRSLIILQQAIEDELGDLNTWSDVEFGSKSNLVNPMNKSTLGMINRGQKGYQSSVIGYALRDKNELIPSYFHNESADGNIYQLPVYMGIDYRQLYPNPNREDYFNSQDFYYFESSIRYRNDLMPPKGLNYGIQIFSIREANQTVYFLKRDNELLQVMIDELNDVTYTYRAELTKTMNYKLDLKMYNNKTGTRKFNIAEAAMPVYGDGALGKGRVPMTVKSLGDHSGYAAKATSPKSREPVEFSTRWKKNGKALSDIKKYVVLPQMMSFVSNLFGDRLKEPGREIDSPMGYGEVFNPEYDSIQTVAFSTDWKDVEFDDYLFHGFEQFVGEEFTSLDLETSPKEENIYQDQWISQDTITATVDWHPPKAADNNYVRKGRIEYKYPNGVVTSQPFNRPNNSKSDPVEHKIIKDYFPTPLNNEQGTIKTHSIEMVAINEDPGSVFDSLPSEESYYNLNVYNLGATPIFQQYPEGTEKYNKKASSIVEKITALPGNKTEVKYWINGKEIADEEVKTLEDIGVNPKQVGIQFVQVKVKDISDGREAIVEVPFNIYRGGTPDGLILEAKNFFIEKEELKGLSDREIDNLVIKESKAFAIDAATGNDFGITISVDPNNRLPYDAEDGKSYKVKLLANKDQKNPVEKIIDVYVGKPLEATPVEQRIPIGKKEIDYSTFVKDVSLGGTTLTPESGDYQVTLANGETIPDVVSKENEVKKVKVTISLTSDPSVAIEKDVPITMTWGNSIAFGGDETGGRMGGGAYALHNDGTSGDAYISAVSGKVVSNDNEAIAKNHGDDYLSIGWYDLSQSGSTYVMSKDTQPSAPAVTAKGTDKKQDTLNKWGTNNVQAVKTGDLVRGWSAEAGKQYMSDKENTTPKALNDKQNDVFYEVTTKGYRRLQFNRYDIIEDNLVAPYSSADELAKNNKLLNDKAKAGEFVALRKLETGETPQAQILGFKDGHYPDLSQPTEKSEAIIVIEETLSTSNKKIQYEVPVSFKILDGTLSFKSATDLSFGEHDLPRSDLYFAPQEKENKVVVEDTRHLRKPWELKARMDEPLHYVAGTTKKPLEGSSIIMFNPFSGKDNPLSSSPTVVKKIENSSLSNEIVWNNEVNEGYRLFVRKGSASDNKEYKSEIIYSIDDAPTTRVAGE